VASPGCQTATAWGLRQRRAWQSACDCLTG
jgi:hypothetical protein